jgi:hypothetical protein
MRAFSFHRLWAIVLKEFIQMRRDRVTFGMMVGIPLMQLLLFGFAINSDPRHLPTASARRPGSVHAQFVAALRHSDYFKPSRARPRPRPRRAFAPARRSAVRDQHPGRFFAPTAARRAPVLLLEADATDPAATGPASPRRALAGLRARPRPHRPAGPPARPAGAGRRSGSRALQPREHHPVQRRARPDGRRAHDDDGRHHRARHHARARARGRWRTCSRRRCALSR